MKGKILVALLAPALAIGFVIQWQRAADRLEANRILRQVEGATAQFVAEGTLTDHVARTNLRLLRTAAELDRSEVGILTALGGQYLLLGRPQAAAEIYREALALEPRPEIYLNLGRAHLAMGNREEARAMFETAVRLHQGLARHVPEVPSGVEP